MGKIYSNHLHFLSYWLKCPVDNTELQWHFQAPRFLGEACPRRWSPLLWSAFGVPTFFLCVHLQNLKLRPPNLYESRKLASHNSCIRWFLKWAIINPQHGSDINRERLETELMTCILKMHAQESSIASVSSIMGFLYANGPALFRETATGLVKLILVMLATNALSEKWFTSALRRISNYPRGGAL